MSVLCLRDSAARGGSWWCYVRQSGVGAAVSRWDCSFVASSQLREAQVWCPKVVHFFSLILPPIVIMSYERKGGGQDDENLSITCDMISCWTPGSSLSHCHGPAPLPPHTAGGGWEHCRRAQDNARNHTSAVTASIYTQCKDASTLHSNVQMSWGPIVANLAFGPIIVLAPSLVC